MRKWTIASILWWIVTWGLRLAIVLAALVVWAFIRASDLPALGATVGTALVMFWLQRVTRRQALGWIIDDNGERQKVTNWGPNHPIFSPTTRSERIVEEARLRDERRKRLLWSGLGSAGLLYVTYKFYLLAEGSSGLVFVVGVITGPVGLYLLFVACRNLAMEVLYLSGWQDMPGAKVLDAPPSRPGLDEVMQQKAHGDGRVASEEEALAILNQGA